MIPFKGQKQLRLLPVREVRKACYLFVGRWSWRGKGGAFRHAGQCFMYWPSDISWMCTHVKVHQMVHLIFVPFSACKLYLKRNYLKEFSILRESFPPASGKAQSKSLQQLRCLRARWWWWRKAEMTTWPIPGFCWDLFKGSYGSITQNLNQKRHSSVMSMGTNYSIRFIMLWFWPPPGYFWPQGQLKWCGP